MSDVKGHQNPDPSPSTSASTGIPFIFSSCSSHFPLMFLSLSCHVPLIFLSCSFHYPFIFLSFSSHDPSRILSVSFHFLPFAFSHFFRIDSQYKKYYEPEHHVIRKTWQTQRKCEVTQGSKGPRQCKNPGKSQQTAKLTCSTQAGRNKLVNFRSCVQLGRSFHWNRSTLATIRVGKWSTLELQERIISLKWLVANLHNAKYVYTQITYLYLFYVYIYMLIFIYT